MINDVHLLKALADETRLRILLLLREKELFVCQLMAVTGLSQSLVSRSLALLEREGLLDSRRQGKHVFYCLKEEIPILGRAVMDALAGQGKRSMNFAQDRVNQRGSSCDMSLVKEFIAFKNQKK
jgi:DNA-binding transcriptional ArsR family regulator